MKAAVVEYTATHYGRRVDDANVLISAGAKPALWNLHFAMVDPGDEVIVLAPYWVSYPEMVRMVRGVPVIVHARDGSLRPSLADLEAARSPRTRAILLNSPNNPSGLAYDDSFVASAVEFAERHGIWLVCDDIYHQLVFDGRSQVPAWQHTTRHVDVEARLPDVTLAELGHDGRDDALGRGVIERRAGAPPTGATAAFLSRSLYSNDVYCEPLSVWAMRPPLCSWREESAICKASLTRLWRMCSASCQPTMRLV